jgi:acyl-ACP--UDP-N-acetylglucosamine O-acyltransferase
VISAIPQDLKFAGERTTAEVGDGTTIRECVTINRGTADRQKTAVGSNCLLMAYVHLAHDCILGNNIVIANSVNLAGHVTIDDWAILEGNVAVQQFIHIGAHSFIAGASLVRKNVPPFVKAAREPLSYVGVNVVGLRRRGFTDDAMARIEDIYREIFVRNTTWTAPCRAWSRPCPAAPNAARSSTSYATAPRGSCAGWRSDPCDHRHGSSPPSGHQVLRPRGRVRGVSHTFASGSRTALLGPNGSGKSTLLQVIGGIGTTSGCGHTRTQGRRFDPERWCTATSASRHPTSHCTKT